MRRAHAISYGNALRTRTPVALRHRTSAREKLLAKKQRLEAAIVKASLPLNQLRPVPEPKFQQELVALKQAKFELDSIVQEINNFDREFNFKDPWLSTVFESEKVQELANLKQQELVASIRVERAIPYGRATLTLHWTKPSSTTRSSHVLFRL